VHGRGSADGSTPWRQTAFVVRSFVVRSFPLSFVAFFPSSFVPFHRRSFVPLLRRSASFQFSDSVAVVGVRSFVRAFVRSLVCSLLRSLLRSSVRPLVRPSFRWNGDGYVGWSDSSLPFINRSF